ncbi:uncharacterized protein LOC112346586 isoform X2 [Selaginella moellendorffii]|uniref:uncharacterized protein LOC112346586 isoform X2 n=1 Tax=Selaginella moellendorffii TaxID=88036 RepID=UPI000D1CFF13|nr:uncharacterized protein LOC112346586 isoform X2 [Selaginella moellendorffii]|eukprot:XP_024531655.1 uncharacterized protein LOC112346586 isoform X2 [Selaginella moellendorffii]
MVRKGSIKVLYCSRTGMQRGASDRPARLFFLYPCKLKLMASFLFCNPLAVLLVLTFTIFIQPIRVMKGERFQLKAMGKAPKLDDLKVRPPSPPTPWKESFPFACLGTIKPVSYTIPVLLLLPLLLLLLLLLCRIEGASVSPGRERNPNVWIRGCSFVGIDKQASTRSNGLLIVLQVF